MSEVRIESAGLDQVLIQLREIPDQVRQALERAVTTEALNLVRIVKEDKLSGQVLGQRTHRLRDAVHMLGLDSRQSSIAAAVGVNLADAKYAAFWEYGFTGVEQIREHLRRITQAFGRPIDPRTVTVRAHARHVDQPARSYLRSTLAEEAAGIRERLHAAVSVAISKSGGGAA